MPWLQLGDRVGGRYLTRTFSGTVIDVGFARAPHGQTYTIKLDEPIDVSESEHMGFVRRRIMVTLDESGASIDTKNRPDNIATVAKI
jgi:Glyoxalase superfamily protein